MVGPSRATESNRHAIFEKLEVFRVGSVYPKSSRNNMPEGKLLQ
jgi:hypothetical protein